MHYILYTIYYILHIVYHILYTIYCTLYTVYFTTKNLLPLLAVRRASAAKPRAEAAPGIWLTARKGCNSQGDNRAILIYVHIDRDIDMDIDTDMDIDMDVDVDVDRNSHMYHITRNTTTPFKGALLRGAWE